MYRDLNDCEYKTYLMDPTHNEEVANYINKEIVNYVNHKQKLVPMRKRDSKIERILNHSAMVIESMSDHQKYAEKKNSIKMTTDLKRHIGLRIPHYDLREEEFQ